MKNLNPHQLIHFRVPEGVFCVSIYARDFTELGSLVELARNNALRDLSPQEVDKLLRPLHGFLERPNASIFPLAIFLSPSLKGWMRLPFTAKGLAVVSRSFHIKPLLKWIQRDYPFSLLLFEKNQARLFQASLGCWQEEEVISYEDHSSADLVIGALDRAVYRTTKTSRTPLILGGEGQWVEMFRNASSYRAILEENLPHFGSGNMERMHPLAVKLLEPHLEKREERFLEMYRIAERNQRAARSLREIVRFALLGRVKLLLVSECLNIWGRIDPEKGTFTYSPQQLNAPEDDILDDLAELVVRSGGSVVVLSSEKMPHGKVACAVLEGVNPAIYTDELGASLAPYGAHPLAG